MSVKMVTDLARSELLIVLSERICQLLNGVQGEAPVKIINAVVLPNTVKRVQRSNPMLHRRTSGTDVESDVWNLCLSSSFCLSACARPNARNDDSLTCCVSVGISIGSFDVCKLNCFCMFLGKERSLSPSAVPIIGHP